MIPLAIKIFRRLLDQSNFHAECANKAFAQKCNHVGNSQTAKSGTFFNAASIVAEEAGFDLRTEQLRWIESKGIEVPAEAKAAVIGTPQSLDEVVARIVAASSISLRAGGPATIQDYIAQGFGAFMLKYPESNDVLEELFKHLTRRS